MNEEDTLVPFSKRTLWTIRGVLLGLAVMWFSLGIYLHHQAAQSKAKVERNRIEAARRQEFQRRGAQYRQDLQNFNQGVRSRNVFDGR
ncbi:MAG: hypothetical protein IJ266_05010 [Elusimicrobiaceae bacterium]|nr:hypothetical protein [Elusimicrobiaceae bacterium]